MLEFLVNQLQTTCYALRFSHFIEFDRNAFFSPERQGPEAFEYLEEMYESVGSNNRQIFDALRNQRDSLLAQINELLIESDSNQGLQLSVSSEEPYRITLSKDVSTQCELAYIDHCTLAEARGRASNSSELHLLITQNDYGELGDVPGDERRFELLKVTGNQEVGRICWPFMLDYDATAFAFHREGVLCLVEISEK